MIGVESGLQPPLEGMWFYLLGVVGVYLAGVIVWKYLEAILDLFDLRGKW
jgi:hypothetical protein